MIKYISLFLFSTLVLGKNCTVGKYSCIASGKGRHYSFCGSSGLEFNKRCIVGTVCVDGNSTITCEYPRESFVSNKLDRVVVLNEQINAIGSIPDNTKDPLAASRVGSLESQISGAISSLNSEISASMGSEIGLTVIQGKINSIEAQSSQINQKLSTVRDATLIPGFGPLSPAISRIEDKVSSVLDVGNSKELLIESNSVELVRNQLSVDQYLTFLMQIEEVASDISKFRNDPSVASDNNAMFDLMDDINFLGKPRAVASTPTRTSSIDASKRTATSPDVITSSTR
ncbi:hypothetical protein BB560_001336 [Smittium megazygosporum]|uniref:Chitin-binding type-2 domain-containing protein n=1 Tax=Smittium megazygosporum TaxID=133381 RepID=A0A2T9ZHY1_9FUNG|nr:hypothetical protein BB560_001336 [Smittium megazygosporum]